MTRIKLCGMMRLCDIEAVNELRPDFCGFILSAGFRRSLSAETFTELSKSLDSNISSVGVFVNDDIDRISELSSRLDLIQLHGNETDDYIRSLRDLTGKPIIKAFKITSPEDVRLAEKSNADYILLDSGTGTGRAFDHSLITGIERPYFLAGGLTPENVLEAIGTLHPFGVDASSSLETDGLKDKNKMAAMVRAVRGGINI